MDKSFKQRIEEFWRAFEKEEHQIRELIDSKSNSETLVAAMNKLLSIAFDEPLFEMGFNDEQGKYELITTPEGDRIKLPLTYYWKQKAPKSLERKWNFYSTRPANHANFGLSMYGIQIDNETVDIYCTVNNDDQKFNIEVYSEKINTLNENQRYAIFFILLDQFLGEAYTMQYVGTIDFIEKKSKGQAITPRQLKELIDQTIQEKEWDVLDNPMEVFSSYSMNPQTENVDDILLRTDIFAGYTSCFPMLRAYYDEESETFDQVFKNGAVYGFLYYDNTSFSTDELLDFRTNLEDEIVSHYEKSGDAYCIGGATGEYFSYIDFVIFDFEHFLQVAKEVVAQQNLEQVGFKYFKQDAAVINL